MKIKKIVPVLVVILAVQLLLVGLLSWRSDSLAPVASNEPLVSVAKDQIEWLRMSDHAGKQIVLRKEKGDWIVPDKFNFPVDKTKLSGVIDSVLAFKKSYPVGKSETSAKQFRVSDADFERKLELGGTGDKVLSTIYFGSSPSFKQVHVRVEKGETHLAEYTVYNLALEPADWLNFSDLSIDPANIKKVLINDVVIESSPRTDGTGTDFVVSGAGPDQRFDFAKTRALASKANSVIFKDVLGRASDEALKALPVVFSWSTETGAATISYEVRGPVKDAQPSYALFVSDRSFVYKITSAELDSLKALKLETLFAEETAPEAIPADNADDSKAKKAK